MFNHFVKRLLPWLAVMLALPITALQLHRQGRLWWCSCGEILLWAGDVCSSHNSQQLLDPYSFTHFLHGVGFCGLLALCFPRLRFSWRLCLAILLESLWEVMENSGRIIQRFREATAALGYHGDTILNSFGDILICGVGFAAAHRLGFKRSLALFLITEIALLLWIRDSLTLEVLMLVYPIDAIKAWQMCR